MYCAPTARMYGTASSGGERGEVGVGGTSAEESRRTPKLQRSCKGHQYAMKGTRKNESRKPKKVAWELKWKCQGQGAAGQAQQEKKCWL